MNTRKLTGYLFLVYFLIISHHTHALEMNGVASFRELGSEVYLGALYLDSRSSDAAAIFDANREKKMELRFSQGMSKRRWAGNWMQSIAINNNRDSLVAAAEELSDILSAFADNLSPGDRVEFHYIPGTGTAIAINGTTLTEAKSVGIFNLFLSAWIGAVPPSSQFKNALLGSEDSAAEQSRFANIQPSQERIAAVVEWAAVEEEVAEAVVEEPPPAPVVEKPEVKPEEIKPQPPVITAAEPEPVVEDIAPPAAAPAAPAPQVVDQNETEMDLSVESILAQQEYTSDLIRKIYREVKYPANAVKRNHQGSVRVNLMVARNGAVEGMSLSDESEFASLNKEALRAITAASPFNPLPSSISENNLEIVVPITFKLAE